MNDALTQARQIVHAKRVEPCACAPRPFWLPRRFSHCSCLKVRSVVAIMGGRLVPVVEARIPLDCCWRHGR